jgi:cell division protein FtsB
MIAELAQSAIVAAALAAGVAQSVAKTVLHPFKLRFDALQRAQEKTEADVVVIRTDVTGLKDNVNTLREGQNTLAARVTTEARNTQKRISRTDGELRRLQADMADAGITSPDEPPDSGFYRKMD